MAAGEWLTTSEAGLLLGVHGDTVRRMCDDGRLQCIKPAKAQRRISKAHIDEYLRDLGHAASPKPTPVPAPRSFEPVSERAVEVRLMERLRLLKRSQLS